MTGPVWDVSPNGWLAGQVKNAATVTLGKMLQGKDSGSDVRAPYMRAANVQPDGVLALDDVSEMWFGKDELEQLSIRAGDVVVVEGGQGGFGRAAYVEKDLPGWGFQNSINRLRPIGNFDGRFIAFYLIALRASGFIRAYSNVVSMPHLTAEKLARIPILLPPAELQRDIADYLERETARIDTLIEEQQRLIEMLRERRRSYASEAIGVRVGRGERLKWYFDELDNRAGEEADTLPLMSVSISWGVRRRDEVTDDASRAEDLSNYKVCRRGDLVINRMRAFQGALGLAPEDGLVSPDYAVLRVKDGVVGAWLAAAMRTDAFVSEMTQRVKGIGSTDLGAARTPRINVSDLAEIRIDVPSWASQTLEVANFDAQIAKVDTLIAESERLVELARERRAALITAAVTGQIDVREMA